MFDEILVPIDGSDCADLAVDYAADIARRYGATVRVLNVVNVRQIASDPHYDQRRDEATELIESACGRLEDAGLPTDRVIRTSVPHQGILMAVEDYDVGLVVMGTHGRTGIDRYLLGSVTERVIRQSDVPVLTVRKTEENEVHFPYSNLLVPTDGSDGAAAAFDPGIDIAASYDATLHSISVLETNALGVHTGSSMSEEIRETPARTALETFEEQATQASVPAVETAIVSGTPHRSILSYVTENEIDLVVLGTHGRSGIPRYLLGSVAENLVRTSPVPVMTVPTS